MFGFVLLLAGGLKRWVVCDGPATIVLTCVGLW